ncbi:MAG: chorismate-binding protein [Akkermansiaceae bacterium]|nr:chorismate-binding protein [Akkermansiaceae bacterium]
MQATKHKEGLAFMKAGDGAYVVGIGPFEEHARAPEGVTAFYCNDFTLSDSRPWKIPAQTCELRSLAEIGFDWQELAIDWHELEAEGFAKVFAEINEMIIRGVIEKSVPVATERGRLDGADGVMGSALIGRMKSLGAPFFSYGWSLGEIGFCGATPELLFQLDGQHLKTMALAGTAKADEREVFAVDGKEIREHEFVAQTLVAKLSDIGTVTRADRSIMDLGQLVHFHTAIEVELLAERGIDELIRRLHPTPALGPLPRTEETLQMLAEWRSRLHCPSCFGAPFGLLKDGVFNSVVAIRGVHWQGQEIAIPSGCGVIEASRLVNEWRELRLKREAVKAVMQL